MRRDATLVAGLTLTELRRHPGAWRLPILSTVLFSLVIVAFGASASGLERRAEIRSFAIAVEGGGEGAQGFVDELATDRLSPRREQDAARAVSQSKAAAGIVVPEDLDRRFEEDEPLEIELLYRQSHNVSLEARALVEARLTELQIGDDAVALTRPGPVVLDRKEVSRSETVNRLRFGRTLAAVVALLCLGLVTSVAANLGASGDRRGREAMLVLPLGRRGLTAGLAAGSLPVVAAQLGAALAVLLGVAMLPLPDLGLSPEAVRSAAGPAAVVVLLLACSAAALGVLASALGAGSEDAVTIGDLLAMPFLAVGLVLFAVPDVSSNLGVAAVPLLGPIVVLRDAVAGDLSAPELAVTALSTTLGVLLVLWVAAGRMGSEQRIRART